MNYTFGKGFNYGFKSSFNSKNKFNFSTFFKNSYNNKNAFNLINSNINSNKFKINFSNKYFIDKAHFLTRNKAAFCGDSILGSRMLVGEANMGEEMESVDTEVDPMMKCDNLIMQNGFFLLKNGKINLYI